MAKTASIEELNKGIERLVQEQIDAIRQAAGEAVEQAFASAGRGTTAERTRPGRTPGARAAKVSKGTARPKRRTPEEIAGLSERLYAAVCATPGETITALRAQVDGSARELSLPMSALKRAGRVRTVGRKHRTRYFPMAGASASSDAA